MRPEGSSLGGRCTFYALLDIKLMKTLKELHDVLTNELQLLQELPHPGRWRIYYHKRIDQNPTTSTRLIKIIFDTDESILAIQLCASSDNNNAVLLPLPIDKNQLNLAIEKEIKLLSTNKKAKTNRLA